VVTLPLVTFSRGAAVRRAGAVLATMAAALAAAGPAHAASTQLVSVEEVAPGVERHSYRYGPLTAGPGQNLNLVGPVTIERPVGAGFVTRVKPNVVGVDGTPPPVERVHMHHAVFFNLSRQDAGAPQFPERFGGFAEEKTTGTLPDPYGYLIGPADVFGINYMLHNGTPNPEEVWITYELDFVPLASPKGATMRPARPVWLDVENGRAYPVFDVERGSGGADGRFEYPDDAGNPYGDGPRRNEWRVDRDGTLVATAGHLHPGGLWTDLEVVRGGARRRVFRSEANYFDPNGPVSWDMAMDHSPPGWRVGIREGDRLRMSTVYETEKASWYESMGIMLVFIADDGTGPNPFETPVATDGEPTHGHLPEAGNYGGAPREAPDPRAAPDGATVEDGVGIADFLYLPGDQSASGVFGLPPVVEPGGQLRFGNFDSAGQILHTVTSCRAPCNRTTGVSYPLADGDVGFDSGQLGYGPEGYSPAAQRADWYTPQDLEPGTYTYFCRVHPYMRGAFRVRGEPRRPGGASSRRVRIESRSLRMSRRGTVRVRLRCLGDPGRCRGRLRIEIPGRRSTLLGSGAYDVAVGRSRVVTVRLSRRARRLVRRRRSVRVGLVATPRHGGVRAARTVRLRAPR
jgi:plastocyanin